MIQLNNLTLGALAFKIGLHNIAYFDFMKFDHMAVFGK
jgi:hypothetical protein